MNQSKHLTAVDQLRGIAILTVVISHCFGYSGSIARIPPDLKLLGDPINFLNFIFHCTIANGFLGVMIFFVLSGFCIRWSHLNINHFTWKNFYQRRFFRIIPAFWFWLVIGSLIANAKLWDFLLHATLIHNLRADSYHSIIAPLWSIAIEWQIYLLYSLILFLSCRFEKRWILLFFALANLSSCILSANAVAKILGSDVLKIFGRLPTALMFSWMLGFYLANAVHEGSNVKRSRLMLGLSLMTGIICNMQSNTIFLSSIPWSLAAYHLVALFVMGDIRLNPIRMDLLSKIGISSYSIYLSHDLFAYIYMITEQRFQLSRGTFADGAVAFCLLGIPMVLVGILSYRFIELPGIAMGKFLGSRLNRELDKS